MKDKQCCIAECIVNGKQVIVYREWAREKISSISSIKHQTNKVNITKSHTHAHINSNTYTKCQYRLLLKLLYSFHSGKFTLFIHTAKPKLDVDRVESTSTATNPHMKWTIQHCNARTIVSLSCIAYKFYKCIVAVWFWGQFSNRKSQTEPTDMLNVL